MKLERKAGDNAYSLTTETYAYGTIGTCTSFLNVHTYGIGILYVYVGPPCCRTEMYAGRVAYCVLVSHGEFANGTDRRTDGRQTVTHTLTHTGNPWSTSHVK